jgi:hypothetical protein
MPELRYTEVLAIGMRGRLTQPMLSEHGDTQGDIYEV